jgi:hypothetical protein
MGNRFFHVMRKGLDSLALDRLVAHHDNSPGSLAVKGCCRGVQQVSSFETGQDFIKQCVTYVLISKCYPCPDTVPTPALSLGRGRIIGRRSRNPASGFARQPVEKPESFASCSLSPRERVRVRGKVCPLFRRPQNFLNRSNAAACGGSVAIEISNEGRPASIVSRRTAP